MQEATFAYVEGRSNNRLNLPTTVSEFPIKDFVKKFLSVIGRSLKKFWQYLSVKSHEGADIYNRMKMNEHERYMKHAFYIRGIF